MRGLYTGEEVCPYCGKSAKTNPRSSRNSLCFECLQDLDLMNKIKRERAEQKEEYVLYHTNRFTAKYLSSFTGDPVGYDNLVKSIRLLIHSLHSPEKKVSGILRHHDLSCTEADLSPGANSYPYHIEPIIREDVAIALDAMITAIENYSHDVYAKGKADGSNLLMSLGKQEITPDAFVEKISQR